MDDQLFLKKFEDQSLPYAMWNHRAHVKVAYLYLIEYPFEQAVERIRRGIKAYNAAHNVPEGLEMGYHETMTQAFMQIVHAILCEYGSNQNADEFFEGHSELWQRTILRLFYTRDHIMSPEAKVSFVQPDLAPLPVSRRSIS